MKSYSRTNYCLICKERGDFLVKDVLAKSIEKLWMTANWVIKARQMLSGLQNFHDESKIVLILRHSFRKEFKNVDEILKLGLTPQGYEIAKKFGGSLPSYRPIRLFHSEVSRCRETAEAIAEGFEQSSGKVEIKGVLEPLFKIGSKAESFSTEVFNRTASVFIARWVAGLYPASVMAPFTSYCQNAASVIWKQIQSAPPKTIDVHITHDTHLMALRWGWFGRPLNGEWVSYLGGFAMAINQTDLTILEGGKFESIEIPYWWSS